jgi:Ca2+-binding EF-hand superfamily protein
MMKKTLCLLALVLLVPAGMTEAQDPKPAPGGDQPKPPVVRPDNPPAPPAPPTPPAPPERRPGRGGLIERLDRNGDGVIDKEELEGAGRIGRRIGRADTNGDGIITREELDGLLGGGQQGGGNGGNGGGDGERPRRRGGADRVKELIERLDRNGNGVIDKDELPEGWGERIGPADTNGDGVITPEELEGLMGGGGRPGPEGGEGDGERPPRRDGNRGRGLVERLDRNGNGVIDKDELPEGWGRRIGGADTNGDGVITPEELEGFLGGGNRPGGGQGGEGDGERPRRREGRGAQELIERLDRNGNGVIDLDELDEGMLERLKPLDANGDGVIDESELNRRRRGGRPGGEGGDNPRPERRRGRPQPGGDQPNPDGEQPKPGVRPLPL